MEDRIARQHIVLIIVAAAACIAAEIAFPRYAAVAGMCLGIVVIASIAVLAWRLRR